MDSTSYPQQQATASAAPASARRLTIWEQIAERASEWVGGTLIDCDDDPFCEPMPEGGTRTVITAMRVRPNGDDGFYFEVDGEAFTCGGSTRYLGVAGASRFGDGFEFRNAFGGHEWHILKPEGR